MQVRERSSVGRYFVFAITLVVIFVLMYLLSSRIDQALDNAERVQFDLRLAELRGAVLLMEAGMVAKDDWSNAQRFIGSNPFDVIETEAINYAGALSLNRLSDRERQAFQGQWLFDTTAKAVVYLPRNPSAFSPRETLDADASQMVFEESANLKFRVVGLWSEEGQRKRLKGLRLNRTE